MPTSSAPLPTGGLLGKLLVIHHAGLGLNSPPSEPSAAFHTLGFNIPPR